MNRARLRAQLDHPLDEPGVAFDDDRPPEMLVDIGASQRPELGPKGTVIQRLELPQAPASGS